MYAHDYLLKARHDDLLRAAAPRQIPRVMQLSGRHSPGRMSTSAAMSIRPAARTRENRP
jgi:hypothetical protein